MRLLAAILLLALTIGCGTVSYYATPRVKVFGTEVWFDYDKTINALCATLRMHYGNKGNEVCDTEIHIYPAGHIIYSRLHGSLPKAIGLYEPDRITLIRVGGRTIDSALLHEIIEHRLSDILNQGDNARHDLHWILIDIAYRERVRRMLGYPAGS